MSAWGSYDAWKLDSPDYSEENIIDKLEIVVRGNIKLIKQLEVILEKAANDLDLDIEY